MSFWRTKLAYDQLSDAIDAAREQHVAALERQRQAVTNSLERHYAFSEKWALKFNLLFSSSSFSLEHHTGQYYGGTVLGLLSSQELHLVADILSVIEAYKEGEIDELPASGEWPEVAWEHFERLRHPQVTARLPKAWCVTG